MAAFAIFFIFLVIIGVGLYSIVLNYVINEIITLMNPVISAGSMSTEWLGYWNFAIGLLVTFPILVLIALTVWAIVRAIERRSSVI